jgi:hypothetical protein
MRRSGVGAGGGPGMNKITHPGVRTGSGSHSIRPAGVSQLGYAVGDHSTNSGKSTGYKGEPLHSPERNFNPVPFGNEVALNVGPGGCGTGRTLYGKSGSQGQHGATNPGNAPAKNRDTLSEFGPDYRRPRS